MSNKYKNREQLPAGKVLKNGQIVDATPEADAKQREEIQNKFPHLYPRNAVVQGKPTIGRV
jgi:hypothetical protein